MIVTPRRSTPWRDSGPARRAAGHRSRGFALVEMMAVCALAGMVVVMAVAPQASRMMRRARGLAALSTIRQVLASGRLEAIKRSANVVVEFSLTSDRRLRLVTFQDRTSD